MFFRELRQVGMAIRVVRDSMAFVKCPLDDLATAGRSHTLAEHKEDSLDLRLFQGIQELRRPLGMRPIVKRKQDLPPAFKGSRTPQP